MLSLPRKLRVLGAGVVLAAACVASLAVAEGFDPALPHTVVVGQPQGPAVRHRIDPGARGQTDATFSNAPAELWRRELAGGLELPPVIDGEGEIVAALVSPDVVRIGRDGRQRWRTRFGMAPAVVAPVLTSNGSTLLVANDGTAWSVSAGGKVRFATRLRFRTRRALATPLALDEGSVVVAGEGHLAIVSDVGTVRSTTRAEGMPVGALLRWKRGILYTTHDGSVFHWRAPKRPQKLGTFGGSVLGGMTLVDDRRVAAVVDRSNVMVLDLKSGNTALAIGKGTTFSLVDGPPTVTRQGDLLVTSTLGELFGIDKFGVVQSRVALEPLPTLFQGDAGAPPPRAMTYRSEPSPPLLVDRDDNVAFMRHNGRFGIVGKRAMTLVSRRFCARPLALLPAGEDRLLVACRGGSIAVFGASSQGKTDAPP